MSVHLGSPFRIAACVAALLAFTSGTRPVEFTSGTPPAGGSIERIAELGTPRSAHTTTALPGGRLLVAGGMGPGGGSLATAELIDISSDRVAPLGPMAHARVGHTATPLGDGRAVLLGGYDGEYLASAEVFDPASGRFEAAGSLLEGRSGHTATVLPDGRVLVVGGVGRGWTFLASAEVFDPVTGRSELVEPLRRARESHTATALDDGRVLVVGGHRGRRAEMEVHASAEIYEPTTGRFVSTGGLGTPRHKHDAVRLADGRVIIIAGADRTDRNHFETTEIYNPSDGTFSPGPSMASSRYKIRGTSVRLGNGDVLVPTGARAAEVLDADSFTFRSVPGDFPTPYFFATATPVSGEQVVIVGGYDSRNRNTGGVWRYR